MQEGRCVVELLPLVEACRNNAAGLPTVSAAAILILTVVDIVVDVNGLDLRGDENTRVVLFR